MTAPKIIHLTTVHPREDVRVCLKEARSAARAFEDVSLVVCDGKGSDVDESSGLRTVDLGPLRGGRISRFLVGSWRVARYFNGVSGCILHFHDPELLFVCLYLKLRGLIVVYDVHEDLPKQINSKTYIPSVLRGVSKILVGSLERSIAKRLSGVVGATEIITDKFRTPNRITIKNYPILEEFNVAGPRLDNGNDFAYVGGITTDRGLFEMLDAFGSVQDGECKLVLAGKFQSVDLRQKAESHLAWQHVDYRGWLDRQGVSSLLAGSRGGLVLLRPTPSYIESLPIKLFEYMAASLPVVVSDFPAWREIVESSGCGFVVNPQDSVAVAKAISWIVENPEGADEMGRRGRDAVLHRYNWGVEEGKLVGFYQKLSSLYI